MRRKCQHCGERKEDVAADSHLCEDCEEHYVYCSICREWSPDDQHCRHVFWTNCGFAGAGATDGLGDYCRESFLEVLSQTGLAREIRAALVEAAKGWPKVCEGCYFLWPLWTWCGDVYLMHRRYYRAFGDVGDDARDGINWLASLVEAPPDPILETIGWIDEWLSAEDRRAALLAYHSHWR